MSNMVINTNVTALNSHRSLKTVGNRQEKASARLSTGYRINSAADDAAGLAISEKMRAQIKGLDMASKNSQDAISLIQTAEGGMQEIDNMVQRIRELVVQASNDTNDQTIGGATQNQGDRRKIQDEIDQLVIEIDSMANRVEFNNKTLINGDLAKGSAVDRAGLVTERENIRDAMQAVRDSIADTTTATALGTLAAAAASTTPGDAAKISAHMAAIGSATNVADMLSALAALQSDTTIAAHAGLQGAANVATAGSIAHTLNADNDTAVAAIKVHEDNIAVAQENLYFQVGANASQSMQLSINSVKTDALGLGDGNGVSSINVMEATGRDITAQLAMLDEALTVVTTERSKLGAAQNRLEYTIKSLDISSENLTASESRIRDTDMAKEMMQLTAANVLQQASTSMLAQANQSKQSILQLLQ